MPAPGHLKSRNDFSRVAAKGRRFRSGHLGLKCVANGMTESRVGYTVSERVARKAVRRNRLRRILRERLREISDSIPAGYDFVLTVSRDPGSGEGKLLRGQLDDLLRDAGLTGEAG